MELSSCAQKVCGGQPAIKRSLNEVQRWKIWLHLHCSIPVLDISPFLSTWVVSLPPYIFLQHTIHVAGDALCRSLRFVEDIWGRHSNAVTDCSDILIPSPTISLSFPFPYIWPRHIQDFSLSFYLGFSVQPTAGFPFQLPQICVRCF